MSKQNKLQVTWRPFSLVLPVSDYEALRARALASERTVSGMVRFALREFLKGEK